MDNKLKANLTKAAATSAMQEMEDRVAHYKAKAELAESILGKLRKERGGLREMMSQLTSAVAAADPWDRVKYYPGDPSRTPVSAVVKLSDWHIGEVIEKGETEGFGEFNWAIAQKRVFFIAEKLIEWTNMHRIAGFPIDELVILSEADLVSGNIHYELEVTNEFPVTVATANAGLLLAEFTSRVAGHFKRVVLSEISADNHGRLTRKNQAKQGGLNNYSFLAHTIANQSLVKHENVKILAHEGIKGLVSIQKKIFLTQHGHGILSALGIPYYGLERARAREAVKRSRTDKEFDYISTAHYHVPAILSENIYMNGSLSGTTEFDHMQGRHAKPSQVSFMVHPKHGPFDFTAWKLS